MTDDLFTRELRYQSIMSVCIAMRKAGTMTDADFVKAEKMMNDKYKPVFRIE